MPWLPGPFARPPAGRTRALTRLTLGARGRPLRVHTSACRELHRLRRAATAFPKKRSVEDLTQSVGSASWGCFERVYAGGAMARAMGRIALVGGVDLKGRQAGDSLRRMSLMSLVNLSHCVLGKRRHHTHRRGAGRAGPGSSLGAQDSKAREAPDSARIQEGAAATVRATMARGDARGVASARSRSGFASYIGFVRQGLPRDSPPPRGPSLRLKVKCGHDRCQTLARIDRRGCRPHSRPSLSFSAQGRRILGRASRTSSPGVRT